MTIFIGVISQKGGVGKSTICRVLAVEYAHAAWDVKIADMDIQQSTSFKWQSRRLQSGIQPIVAVEIYKTVETAIKHSKTHDLVIFDGAPHSSAQTLKIAEIADLLVIPTSTPIDDLEPAVELAQSLEQKGIKNKKIVFGFSLVGKSERQMIEAREYIKKAGYRALQHALPRQDSYICTSDKGLSLTENSHPILKNKAIDFAQDIINILSKQVLIK